MSRSGYSEDCWGWELAQWRGSVARALKGRRGQAFLREMLTALDAMPEKRLIRAALEEEGEVCAIGAVGKARGVNMDGIDPEDRDAVAKIFGIAPALVAEIADMNDEMFYRLSPESRFDHMREWVASKIMPTT